MTIGWLLAALGLLSWPGRSPMADRLAALQAAGRVGRRQRRHRLPASRFPDALDPQLAWLAGAATTVVAVVVAGPWLGAAGGLVCAVGLAATRDALRRRSASRSRRQALAAARAMAAEVAAGSSASQAFEAASAAAPDHSGPLGAAARIAADGRDGSSALVPCPDLAAIGHACRVSAESGSPLGAALQRAADDLADAQRRQQAVAVAVAGPRSSAVLLALLPVVGVGLGVAMGADPIGVLFGTRIGRALCAVGVGLDALGIMWTLRLVRRAEEQPA